MSHFPNRLYMVADILEGEVRRSRRGVPHIVVGSNGFYGSACYFKRTKVWKFFYPYATGEQTVKTFHNTARLGEFVLGGGWLEELRKRLRDGNFD